VHIGNPDADLLYAADDLFLQHLFLICGESKIFYVHIVTFAE
jgi:hypothetical protein